uniref:Uncharacterized protein n=1 Tax=Arundo donax TaxID=35708 RepID=A0A0A9HEL6_ARUDO
MACSYCEGKLVIYDVECNFTHIYANSLWLVTNRQCLYGVTISKPISH